MELADTTLLPVCLCSSSVTVACYAYLLPHSGPETKPIILYVNQGNGVVNRTNFDVMAGYANSSGFNTVFFQIYRKGALLFSPQDLQTFVTQAHLKDLENLLLVVYHQFLPADTIVNLRIEGRWG